MPTKPKPTDDAPSPSASDDLRAYIQMFNEGWEQLNLVEQISRISGMLGGLEKRGYNAFHKYHFVREGDVVDAVRQYLAAAGILIIPNAHSVSREGDLTTLMVEYTVTNGKESFTFSMPGQGSDKGDKGVYKAMTGSQKYALMKLFKIETGDDPEGDTRVDERAATATVSPARPVNVTAGSREGVGRGAHTEKASPVQVRRVSELMKTLDWERGDLVAAIAVSLDKELVLPTDDDTAAGKTVLAFLRSLTTEEIGTLIGNMADIVEMRATEARADASVGTSDYA